MLNKWKSFLKLNNWKRWFILIFSLISIGLFAGLSFALKSKETKLSKNYSNHISLVIKPKDSFGNNINDEAYSRQLLFNLKNRLSLHYPDSIIEASLEQNDTWKIDATNIKNKKEFQNFLESKQILTITPISHRIKQPLYQSSENNLPLFNSFNYSNNSLSATLSNLANDFKKWTKTIKEYQNDEKIIIWKNYDILTKIIEQDKEGWNGSMYEYLFEQGYTPEQAAIDNENSSTFSNVGNTTRRPIFKDKFVLENSDGTTTVYKATDFIVSKNEISNFSNSSNINFSKNFEVANLNLDQNQILKEFYDFSFWISDYDISNYSIVNLNPTNGINAFTFLIIAFIVFFTIISIFVVINYGYLGLFAIFIMSIIIFLSLLMVCVFFGDYDSLTICSIIVSAFIVAEFVVSFFEKIKSEFKKNNSVSKAIKNTIKKTKYILFIKSLLLIICVGIFYAIVSNVTNDFSIIVLLTTIAIPIIIIPLIIGIANTIVGIEFFKQNPKLIGYWRKQNIQQNTNENESVTNELDLNDTIDTNVNAIKNHLVYENQTKQMRSYAKFKRVMDKSSWKFLIVLISYILVFGLIIFLISFFINGQSLKSGFHNLTSNDQQQIVLRVSKTSNTAFDQNEKEDIINTIGENGIKSKDINVLDNSVIEIKLDKDFSTEKINKISNELLNLYDLIVIPYQLINSNTFEIMRYTLFAALIAMIAMCVFVLIWMNWTHALSILIVSAISILLFIFTLGFGLMQINPLVMVAALFGFILLTTMSTNVIIKTFFRIKRIRIEETTTNEIKDIVYKQVFKSLKSIFFTLGFVFLMFIIFAIFPGALPLDFLIFILGITIINTILVLFLLPKSIIWLESRRANMKRKAILENYWDTDIVKEQTFNGINNIK